MKRLCIATAMMLFGIFATTVVPNGKDTAESLQKALVILDTTSFGVPHGTPKDEACQAFWRMSAYQDLEVRFNKAKIKNQKLKEVLVERVQYTAQIAAALIWEKTQSGQAIGCGGQELPDDFILGEVHSACGAPCSELPINIPPTHTDGGKKNE